MIASELFPQILLLHKSEMEQFIRLNENRENFAALESTLKRGHFCLKILRKMAVYGFEKPSSFPFVVDFYNCLFLQLKPLLLLRKQHESSSIKDPVEKYINVLMKCIIDLLDMCPVSFLNFLSRALELSVKFGFSDSEENLLYEKFTVQTINLLRYILTTFEYQTRKKVENTKSESALQAFNIKKEILDKSSLEQICYKLVTKYFILSRDELVTWDGDPENFCTEVEGGDSWKYSLRPAAEGLFKKMFHDYKDEFKPVLTSLMNKTMTAVDPSDIQGILSKDAVYNAVGLSSFDLFDEVNFDDWFKNHLVHELKVADSNYRILRRRVIWLVGQWAGVRFSSENRPLLYEACIHLLANDSDFVVRFNTAVTLKLAIDDFDFDRDCFLPYLSSTFTLLFNLLKDARECDAKMQVSWCNQIKH